MLDHEGDSLAQKLVIGLEDLWRKFPGAQNVCAEQSPQILSIHPVVSLMFGHARQEAEKVAKKVEVYLERSISKLS